MDRLNWVSSATKITMFVIWVLFCLGSTTAAVSRKAVPPPHDVVINQSQLSWNSTAKNVTFTVEYRSFSSDWTPIQACSNTPLTSCDFGLGRAEAEYGCVQVRVAARRNGETSESVEACSREGDPCTPNVTLTAAPGSLTVNLKRDHDLDKEHASNLKHRIYLGKKGGNLELYKDSISSEFIDGLEVGQQYCVTVAFVLHWEPLGPASCVQCETIPGFSGSKQTQIIVVSVVISGIFLLVGITYIHLFKSRKIKQLLQPPCTIPSFFQEPLSDRNRPFLAVSPTEEPYEVVCGLTPR
ncbi:hypothetical protein CRENBAI_001043 [Crenichthys baileyi]|uniref:Fibronectin type-III domain-containing protein n=1 Tax=Crenichthys baileyi TaxID=28760 RepID=A0AAV9RP00_9TELE